VPVSHAESISTADAGPTAPPAGRGGSLTAPLDRGVLRVLSRPITVVALVGALVAVTLTYAWYGLTLPLRTDYLAMLAGARVLAGGGCLYCHAAQAQAEALMLGAAHPSFDPFLETPVVALAFRPLLGLPASAGYAVFLALSLGAVAAGTALAVRHFPVARGRWALPLLALAFVSLPAAWNYHLGQVDALLVLPLVGAAVLLATGRPLAAGLALSLLILKPQTVWLVPVALLAARQWRGLAGMIAGAALWAAASLWSVGPAGVGQWLALLAAQGPPVDTSVGIPGAVASLFGGGAGFATAALLGLAACAGLVAARRLMGDPQVALALGVTLSLLVAPHVYAYDLIALALPLLVLAERNVAAALWCGLLLSATHLVDTFYISSGPHLEALALLAVAGMIVREMAPGHAVGRPRVGRDTSVTPITWSLQSGEGTAPRSTREVTLPEDRRSAPG
jgi:hypothetical protein